MYLIIFLWQGGGAVGFFLSASISDRKCEDIYETHTFLQAETPTVLKDLGCILQSKSPKRKMTVRLEKTLPLMSVSKGSMHRIPPQLSFWAS